MYILADELTKMFLITYFHSPIKDVIITTAQETTTEAERTTIS